MDMIYRGLGKVPEMDKRSTRRDILKAVVIVLGVAAVAAGFVMLLRSFRI